MNKIIFIITLLLFPCLQAQEVEMSESEIENFKLLIKNTSKSTSTITADFVQLKHLDFLTSDIKTRGKLAFKTPNWVKWEYTDPYRYSIVFKNNEILINDGGTKSNHNINSSKLFKKLNNLIVNSITGDMFDEESFNIFYFNEGDYYKIIFDSKDKKLSKLIETFIIKFQKDSGAVYEVKMVEPSQDYTKINFSNRVENANLKDEVFTN